MTRINSGVDPKELHRLHLIAEYREITMVPASLRRSLLTRKQDDVLNKVPKEFTLNKGHVSFFYDKLDYLIDRFHRLVHEMQQRGYTTTIDRAKSFTGFPKEFYGQWQETSTARDIVLERINARKDKKPHLYT
jgi:deoxyribonuclease (pyrimidine dimer)